MIFVSLVVDKKNINILYMVKFFKNFKKSQISKQNISSPVEGTFKDGNNARRIIHSMTQAKEQGVLIKRPSTINKKSKRPVFAGVPKLRRAVKRETQSSKKKRQNGKRKGLTLSSSSNSSSINSLNSSSGSSNTNNNYSIVTPKHLRNSAPQVPSKMKRFSHNNALRICTGLSKDDCDKHNINCKYTSKCIPKAPPKTMKKLRKFSKTKSTKRVRFTDSTKSSNA